MPSLSSFAPPDKIFSAQFPPEEINEAAVRREGFEQYHSKLAASGRRNSATMIEQEMQDLRKMNQQLRYVLRASRKAVNVFLLRQLERRCVVLIIY